MGDTFVGTSLLPSMHMTHGGTMPKSCMKLEAFFKKKTITGRYLFYCRFKEHEAKGYSLDTVEPYVIRKKDGTTLHVWEEPPHCQWQLDYKGTFFSIFLCAFS